MAGLVFLHLLKSDAEPLCQFALREPASDPPGAHVYAHGNIDGIGLSRISFFTGHRIAAAITGLSVHLCVAQAFRYGDAIVVVPLDFLRVPLIALIGWSFYGEPLDAVGLAGAGLIMGGVIWNLRTEARSPAEQERLI